MDATFSIPISQFYPVHLFKPVSHQNQSGLMDATSYSQSVSFSVHYGAVSLNRNQSVLMIIMEPSVSKIS